MLINCGDKSLAVHQRRYEWTGDFKCREVKTVFCLKRWMQTGSSGTLIGWKSGQTTYVSLYTDKKENQIFPIYKEILSGAVAKSYMTNGRLIYEQALPHIWLCNCSTQNFQYIWGKIDFRFYRCRTKWRERGYGLRKVSSRSMQWTVTLCYC